MYTKFAFVFSYNRKEILVYFDTLWRLRLFAVMKSSKLEKARETLRNRIHEHRLSPDSINYISVQSEEFSSYKSQLFVSNSSS